MRRQSHQPAAEIAQQILILKLGVIPKPPRFHQRGEGSRVDCHRPLFAAWSAYGLVILSGLTSWSNSSPVRYPSFKAASRKLVCST